MKTLPFIKMHGCANDFVLIDGFARGDLDVETCSRLARAASDRRRGVGSDGLVVVQAPSPGVAAHARMAMFNPDGSEAEMCGNGLRCLGKFLFDRRRVGREFRIETASGVLDLAVEAVDAAGLAKELATTIGVPDFERARIPMVGPPGAVLDEPFELAGRTLRVSAVNLGNPHCVLFVDDVDHFPVASVGPAIEGDARFPERVNVEFVEVVGADELRQRTWERGAGETLACGSGATAAAIIARKVKGFGPEVRMHLRGGDLTVRWPGDGKPARLHGPAVEVFTGTLTA